MRARVKYPKRRTQECPFCHAIYWVRREGPGTLRIRDTFRRGRKVRRIDRDWHGRPERDYHYVAEEPHDCEEGRKARVMHQKFMGEMNRLVAQALGGNLGRRKRR